MTFQDGFKFQDFPGFSMTVGTLQVLQNGAKTYTQRIKKSIWT